MYKVSYAAQADMWSYLNTTPARRIVNSTSK